MSHGPGSSDDYRNTRRRLDTFSKMLEVPSYCNSQRTFPQPTGLSGFIVKQALILPGLHLRQEPHVKTSWYVSRMMVSHILSIVSSVTPVSLLWCANQNPKMTVKLENDLHHSGKLRLKSYKNSSLTVILKVISLSLLSMFELRSSTLTIAETKLEKSVFKLAPLGHDQMFDITAPRVCEPHIFDDVLQQIVSEATNPSQIRTAHV